MSGLSSSGLVLHLSAGSISEDKPIAVNNLYDFAGSFAPNTGYTVSISTQPLGNTCTIANGDGTVGTTPIDTVDVTCGAVITLIWDSGTWGQK